MASQAIDRTGDAAAEPLVDGVFTPEHELFRETVRRFIADAIEPHYRGWERNGGGVPKEVWAAAGQLGLVGTAIPESHGGAGGDHLFTIIHAEEMGKSRAGASVGGVFENDMLTKTLIQFGSDAQKDEWFPRILSGEVNQAFGMTEPDAGSDIFKMRTRARRDGDDYVISGQKVYISNGIEADLLYVVAKTDADAAGPRHAMSIFAVDGTLPGIERRRMETLGVKSQGVAELFFDEVRVPKSALIGEEGVAMTTLLPPFFPFDRTLAAVRSLAAAELAFEITVDYARQREVFGKAVLDYQNSQFKLAEIKGNLIVGRAFRKEVLRLMALDQLDEATASTAKFWYADMAFKTANECLQLHGGFGYMDTSDIARLFTFTRLCSIYAGTSEMQKRIIAKTL